MIRTKILGLGSYVPDRVVDQRRDSVPRRPARPAGDPADRDRRRVDPEAHRHRERRYVPNDGSIATSDLALAGREARDRRRRARARPTSTASSSARCRRTFTSPAPAVLLQKKLGIAEQDELRVLRHPPAVLRRSSTACRWPTRSSAPACTSAILLVGAELHSHSLDYSTRGRDVMVLFGDGAGAMVLGPMETDDPRSGVMYTSAHADGTGAMDLYLKIFEIARHAVPRLRPARSRARTS